MNWVCMYIPDSFEMFNLTITSVGIIIMDYTTVSVRLVRIAPRLVGTRGSIAPVVV